MRIRQCRAKGDDSGDWRSAIRPDGSGADQTTAGTIDTDKPIKTPMPKRK
jgi:hypothetical protein